MLQKKDLASIDRPEPWTLGDHPALNLLNTISRVEETLVDSLQNDDDVLQWLAYQGWPVEDGIANLATSSLLRAARTLREVVRTAVEQRKAGKRVEVEALNAFLARSQSHLELDSTRDKRLKLHRRWRQQTADQVLAPLAESAAALLAETDFSLVRRCEDAECVLWFYDRTRSHHRRWCSMAGCGNRNKVAAFRRRQQA